MTGYAESMKKLFAIIVLGLFWGGTAYAKIDWQKRNLCEDKKYKSLCSKIVNKKLFGLNTIANFKFVKLFGHCRTDDLHIKGL